MRIRRAPQLLLSLMAVTVLAVVGCTSTAPGSSPNAAPSAPAPTGSQPGSAAPSATGTPVPAAAAPCTIFPADNIWHADVSKLPVLAKSSAYVSAIGAGSHVHADFGSGTWEGAPIGIPVTTVRAGQPTVKVSFQYARESDRGPYPIPRDARIEGGPSSGGDRHVIVFDPARCRSYELYAAYPAGDGSWRAGSGAVFDLRGNALRPRTWTSADAAGLSILAGLIRYDEVAAGRINHAIRMTVPRTRNTYVWPARHAASDLTDASLPPMGLRLRLKAGIDISRMPKQARIVAEAMQRYGLIIADNGSPWYISGAPDDRWSNGALHALDVLRGSDFEVVDTAGLLVSPDSAAFRR